MVRSSSGPSLSRKTKYAPTTAARSAPTAAAVYRVENRSRSDETFRLTSRGWSSRSFAISFWLNPSAHRSKTGRSSAGTTLAISASARLRSIAASIVSGLLAASRSSRRSLGSVASLPPTFSLRTRSIAIFLATSRPSALQPPTVVGCGFLLAHARNSTLLTPSSISCFGQRLSSRTARMTASTRGW